MAVHERAPIGVERAFRWALTLQLLVWLSACAPASDDGATVILDLDSETGASVDGGAVDTTPPDASSMTDAQSIQDAAPTDTLEPDAAPSPQCPTDLPAWTPGTPAFRDVTEAWGLNGVEGEYLSITDVDGDGWPDVLVRKGGGPDDFGRDGVRHKWLLHNTGEGRFEDPTKRSQLFASRLETSVSYGRPGKVLVSGDVDNDGDLDVYIGQGRTDPNNPDAETSELMLNDGDGTFTAGPEDSAARFVNVPSNPAGVSFVDFDRDGLLDLWVVHNETSGPTAMQDTLLKGDGEGGFVDVTHELGLTTVPWSSVFSLNQGQAHSWGWGGVACDLDDDGLPELMASSYGRFPNHLWAPRFEEGSVRFENQSVTSGYAFDENEDWTDNLSAQCYCADTPTAPDCNLCPAPADPRVCDALRNAFGPNYRWSHANGRQPFSLGGVTGTTVCTDVDNDGHLDLVNYEIVHSDTGLNSDPTQVLFNRGEVPLSFERPGVEATGLTRSDDGFFWDHGDMTGAVFDFDNDGWSDIYIGAAEYAGNRGLLYRQTGPRRFEELPVTDYFEHYRAHGVAIADFDRDGDLDVLIGHSRFRCEGFEGTECAPTNQVRLYENLVGNHHRWIQLRLEGGEGSNRSAIGARVAVTANGVTQTQIVDGGHGRFGLQRDPTLHFGLGTACRVEVTITWPDARRTKQSFEVEPDQRLRVRQGEEPEVVSPLP